MPDGLIKALSKLRGARVLVIGDVILDEHVWSKVNRISPEAPVPVAEVTRVTYAPGGAANAANNIRALGGQAQLVGVIGADSHGEKLRQILQERGIAADGLIVDPERPTTMKSRIIAHSQQVVRVDRELAKPVNARIAAKILKAVISKLNDVDAVLISDYAKGVLTPGICRKVVAAARALGKVVSADPKGKDYRKYLGATVITPNAKEAEEASGIPVASNEAAEAAGRILLQKLKLDYVLITRGEKGMSLIGQGMASHIPAVSTEVYDITGAGDTAVATLTMALAAGIGIEDATRIANWAAGVVVRKIGIAVATAEEIEQMIRYGTRTNSKRKIVPLEDLQKIVSDLREQNRKIVFTNGCFDLLHMGHVKYLQEARDLGDVLIVGVNTDESVKKLKGANRPLMPLADRMQLLAALECVDYVIPFPELTPEKLIGSIKPDIHVKGGDYRPEDLPEAKLVESYGGKVAIVNLVEGKSTSSIIDTILKRFSPG